MMGWGKERARKKSHVLPDNDEDGVRRAAKYAPHIQRASRPAGVRWSSPRTWIWFLLVTNLAVVLFFIFLSASFFPDANSPLALLHHTSLGHEPLEAKRSGASLRPLPEESILEQEARRGAELGGDDQLELPTMDLQEEIISAVNEAEPPESVVETEGELQEAAKPSVDTRVIYEETTTTEQLVAANDGPTAIEEDQATERVPETTETQELPPHIADMLARVKAAQEAATSEQQRAEAAVDVEAAPHSVGDADTERRDSVSMDQVTSQPVLLQDLFVWLKADEGVEVVDRVACIQSQDPDACELTSWTNQIRSTNSLVPTAFHPASVLRPVWLLKTNSGGSDLPAVAFSCPLKAKHASFPESMTLFFVLSPTSIEEGGSYAGQKFFGSSPYGQFALHGGKPAFFGSTGLIESDEALEPSRPSILAYRLQRQSVEIRADGRPWTPLPSEPRPIRLSQNAEISLGNAKPVCDTNAFRGLISEVMLYSVALADERVEAVEQYLRSRYASTAGERVAQEQEPTQPVDQDAETTSHPQAEQWSDPTPEATETAGDALVTGGGLDTDRPTLQEPPTQVANAEEAPGETASVDDYDPELVFEWVPSRALLDAKGMAPAAAEQWAGAVRESVERVQTFQLGGEPLRAFIREQKQGLLRLHDALFGPSSRG